MNKIKMQIDTYLASVQAGEAEAMSEEIIERFAERCKDTMRRQFSPRDEGYTIRMSGIGKPLCQQQLASQGATREVPNPALKMNFTFGDLTEVLLMAVMEAAGVNIESYHDKVEYKLGDTIIKGELDVVIDGKVYDIKSTSTFGFKNKFNHENGFENMAKDDAFGYIPQGYLYGAAHGKPFGGWIALSKEKGAYAVLETPVNGDARERAAISTARTNADAIVNDLPFKRCFKPEPETYYKKPTGDHKLCLNCSYCDFKKSCWGDEIEFRQSNKAKSWGWFFNK